ncbi:DNA topoisomerase III [Lactobacillus selangorensis]|uniref:DNA topoisomerase n=1 Tax=Lactobacillus selangorensis TaxID=81857 RepID=A0A0R2FIN5_9LACO|nr:DNA topoisomerase 3 [Lactobacillus selangorensis]KRN28456.1 DNA topoisomerase III [Lactobacillus selangorensis]KRN31957.1 DNA topoisomerase III [Lactobacillus selangorensis]
MSKTLVLAEKPSVAKELARVLQADQKTAHYYEGKNYIVTWALGHLLGLKMPEQYHPQWQKWTFETLPMLPTKFEITPLPKTGAQLKAIKQLARRKDVNQAVIATDAGREGELVARFIFDYIDFKKPLKRLWISSQTDKAIKAGFAALQPDQNYEHLYQAAMARSEADWLIGLNVSRALTVKYHDSLSAGRVQTPTLAFVAEREQAINHFKPQTYQTLQLQTPYGTAALQPNKHLSADAAQKMAAQVNRTDFKVTAIDVKTKHEKAPLPYDLTALQQVANERYHFSAKETLNLLQRLYERYKLVTYPRTDSRYLTTDLKATMTERLNAISGYSPEAKKWAAQKQPVIQTQVFNNSKVGDHYGLIPTEERGQLNQLDNDELKIYRLIVDQFLLLFKEDHVEKRSKVTLQGGQFTFTFTYHQVLEPGFKDDQKTAPLTLKQGASVKGQAVLKQQTTKPPKRLTEATLLAQMEKYGLGTPATRADILEKLVSSGLMKRQSNELSVTPKGTQLLDLVNPSLVSPKLTAQWEADLKSIEQGDLAPKTFIATMRDNTVRLVKEIKGSKKTYKDPNLTQKKCPQCGSRLREKQTRQGTFYVCSNPDCDYRRRKDPKVTNHRCPQCHHKMVLLKGANGEYFKCQHCGFTEKPQDKKHSKRMNKHEEKKLLQKYSPDAQEAAEESPLAAALKAAMHQDQ